MTLGDGLEAAEAFVVNPGRRAGLEGVGVDFGMCASNDVNNQSR